MCLERSERNGTFNEKRDETITIYDINLDYLRNIDYNKIKKGTIYDLEKILYIFVCDNKKLLDYVYEGDVIMDKVRDDFDVITYETDSILYYNPEDLYDSKTKEKIREACRKGREEGMKKGIEKGMEKGRRNEKIKIAKNFKKLNIPLDQISKATGLTICELEKL